MEDTSLDQFADAAAGDDDSAEEETAASADTEADDDAVPADVDPAVSTATWEPDGGNCAACGSAVERRWADDGALVCADCKDW